MHFLSGTIMESYKMLNNEKKCFSKFKLNSMFGVPVSYQFGNPNNKAIPIEHYGLTKTFYEEALKTFYVKKINDDKSEEMVFDKLSQGSHIADCFNNFSKDILNWYADESGNPLKLIIVPQMIVQKPYFQDYSRYTKSSDEEFQQQIDYRKEAVTQGFMEALKLYSAELVDKGEISSQEELLQVLREERSAFDATLQDFSTSQSTPLEDDISQ